MPCAANPKGMSAQNAATTPVYNVMGLDDKIMNGQVRQIAEDFIAQMRALGGEAEYETVPGWTHETTCIQSYSEHRLGWLFAHSRLHACCNTYRQELYCPHHTNPSTLMKLPLGVHQRLLSVVHIDARQQGALHTHALQRVPLAITLRGLCSDRLNAVGQ